MPEPDGGEHEFGDLEGVQVGAAPRLHVRIGEEVVPSEHAQDERQTATLQEVELEVTGVISQSSSGWHQQRIHHLRERET